MHASKFTLGLLLLSFSAAAAAQDYAYRGEVYGSFGGGKIWHDEGSLGGGANYGGGFGFRLTREIGLEMEINGMDEEHRTAAGTLTFRSRPVYFTGNILRYFSASRVQPYVLFGAGILYYQGSIVFRTFPDPLDPSTFEEHSFTDNDTGFAWTAGVGFKTFLNRHLSLRPEFRFFYGRPANEPAIPEPPIMVPRISLAMSYHW